MVFERFIRYVGLAVELMEIERVIRYPARGVGLKPSAIQGQARLRGLERMMYSRTISPTASQPGNEFEAVKRVEAAQAGFASPGRGLMVFEYMVEAAQAGFASPGRGLQPHG